MKNRVDMTSGSLGPKIILYAIPLALTGILQQLFNAADIAVVGQFAGKEAMAAVGSNGPVIGLLVNLFVGISLGSNVIIARSIGQNNQKMVSKAVRTSILVAPLAGLVMTVLGEIFVEKIIAMLDVPIDVFPLSVKYLRIYLLGMPVILLYNFEAAVFRSVGNTKMPLIALAVSGVLNVFLNLVLVLCFNMKVEGVAIATVVSNFVSSAMLFIALLKTESVVRLELRGIRIYMDVLSEMLRIGVPAGVQGMIFSFANIIIQSAVNSLGTTVIAASSAGFTLECFAYYIMNSFGQACTTFVGQNYGAAQYDRCRRTLRLCIMQDFAATAASCILILVFSNQLLRIFNTDPEVIRLGKVRLEYIFIAYGMSFVQEVLSGYLRGFGVSFIPALCTVVGICGVRLTWIFTVFRMMPSFETVMLVYPISLGITSLVMLTVTLIIKPSVRYRRETELS